MRLLGLEKGGEEGREEGGRKKRRNITLILFQVSHGCTRSSEMRAIAMGVS